MEMSDINMSYEKLHINVRLCFNELFVLFLFVTWQEQNFRWSDQTMFQLLNISSETPKKHILHSPNGCKTDIVYLLYSSAVYKSNWATTTTNLNEVHIKCNHASRVEETTVFPWKYLRHIGMCLLSSALYCLRPEYSKHETFQACFSPAHQSSEFN